jgi:hypothetical protein
VAIRVLIRGETMGGVRKQISVYLDSDNQRVIDQLPTGQRNKAINEALRAYSATKGAYQELMDPGVMLAALANTEARLTALEVGGNISSGSNVLVDLTNLRDEVLKQGEYLESRIDNLANDIRVIMATK